MTHSDSLARGLRLVCDAVRSSAFLAFSKRLIYSIDENETEWPFAFVSQFFFFLERV